MEAEEALQRLIAIRKSVGKKTADVAKACGVTYQHIWQIENGKSGASVDVLAKYANALGYDLRNPGLELVPLGQETRVVELPGKVAEVAQRLQSMPDALPLVEQMLRAFPLIPDAGRRNIRFQLEGYEREAAAQPASRRGDG
jgi:transcriptional regulator with XRE-family HTH domain